MTTSYSWGNYPNVKKQKIHPLWWTSDPWPTNGLTLLPYGNGLSYGDSCLNQNGILLSTHHLNRFINFNPNTGIIHCECGVMLGDILQLIIPKGWFLSALPGTQYVTVGGAIANDVHGKDHWLKGSFGNHVTELTLLRSDGRLQVCSTRQNEKLFFATIGGLGLTGLIVSAKIQCDKTTASVHLENSPFNSIQECFELFEENINNANYMVAWINLCSSRRNFSKGIFSQASPSDMQNVLEKKMKLNIPYFLPNVTLNRYTVSFFNQVYWHRHKNINKKIHYQKFFFPLDHILNWNKIYGRRGFLQYQFVAPSNACIEVLNKIKQSKPSIFLTTIKKLGKIKPRGLLSFPKEGYSMAFDLPFQGNKTLALLNDLDELVLSYQGKIYPAKDARMSTTAFQTNYPSWKEFTEYTDIKFSSDFWQRVITGEI